MTDPTPTPEPDDDAGPDSLAWSINMYGGGTGILRQVAFGLGGGVKVLLEAEVTDDGTGMTMALTVGDGPDPTDGFAEALGEVCELLESFAEGLRDSIPDLAAARERQLAAEAEGDDDGEH